MIYRINEGARRIDRDVLGLPQYIERATHNWYKFACSVVDVVARDISIVYVNHIDESPCGTDRD